MNYRIFEENIKDKLYNDEADLDVNQFIMDLRKKERKSPKGFLFLLSALGLIALGVYLNVNNSFESTNIKTSVSKLFPSINTNNSLNTNDNINDNQPTVQSQLISNNEPFPATTIKVKSEKESNSNSENISSSMFNDNANQKPNQKSNLESTYKSSPLLRSIDITSQSTLQKNNHTSNQDAIISNDNNAKSTNEALIQEKKTTNKETQNISFLSLLQPKLLSQSSIEIPSGKNKEIQCPTFRKGNAFVFSINPEAGYFRPLKQLSSNSAESAVFNLRNKNEKTLEGLQAALYMQVQKNKSPIYFKTGLHYAQLTEKMNLSYTYTKQDTTQGIISITVSQTGDTITTIYGDIVTSTTLQGTKVGHHKFELIDIPVSIGYEKSFGSFNIGGELGASLNVSLTSTGKLLETTVDFKNLSKSNSPYKTKLGINYFGSIFIAKEIVANQSVYLALRGRMIPSSFTNVGETIAEKYSMVGLHLGYKISF